MREVVARKCDLCGSEIAAHFAKHTDRCASATESEREVFFQTGRWPPSDPEHSRKQEENWRKANPEKVRSNDAWQKVKSKYGVTRKAFEALLSSQGGVCAICRKPCSTRSRLSVDHDHSTGKVRGLLCQNCNVGVAQFRDDPLLLRLAAEYLEIEDPTTISLRRLLDRRFRLYFACTGAGAGLQKLLWGIPGISSVLVGANFPYGADTFDEFVRLKSEGYCNERAAMDLAQESYYRAYRFDGHPAIGLGLTASVTSTRVHRGEHRVFVAIFSDEGSRVTQVTLGKGGVGRTQRRIDGSTCDQVGVRAILCALGEGYCLPAGINILESEDMTPIQANSLARDQFFKHPFFSREGKREEFLPACFDGDQGGALYPGNFFPPHEGHFGVADTYSRRVSSRVAFTVDATAPNRDGLSVAELLQRAKLLKGNDVLFTDHAPLYLDKARRYPGRGILIGVDAFERMLEPKWGPGIAELARGFIESRTFFQVVDRVQGEELRTLSDVRIPQEFTGVPCFRLPGRWDVSSTELREGRAVA